MPALRTKGGAKEDSVNAKMDERIAMVRGMLAAETGNPDLPYAPVVASYAEGDAAAPGALVVDADTAASRETLGAAMEAYRAAHGGNPGAVVFTGEGVLTVTAPPAPDGGALANKVAVVTGAAGAIGRGITRALMEQGCRVLATDAREDALEDLRARFAEDNARGMLATAVMDVTDGASVAAGLGVAVCRWGGVDIAVVNAGIAHVAALSELDVETFRKLERVNVEGTLLTIRESSRLMMAQATGGDIVLISTKNVFAPGARFGAYSATKAASHQLARIASLELAEHGIRVNMVAPDAVFHDDDQRSGLWATVGPDRMKARGLTEQQLEQYYQSRNLLKAQVTTRHVANAVLFFVTHQTPTTGATIPVDGGLPDATPR